MGLVQCAVDVTKNSYNQTNDMANLLGVGMATGKLDSLPGHEREMGGLKGYTGHRGQQELQRQAARTQSCRAQCADTRTDEPQQAIDEKSELVAG